MPAPEGKALSITMELDCGMFGTIESAPEEEELLGLTTASADRRR